MARQELRAPDPTGAGTGWAGLLLPRKLAHLPGPWGPDGLSGSAAAVGLWPAAPRGSQPQLLVVVAVQTLGVSACVSSR